MAAYAPTFLLLGTDEGALRTIGTRLNRVGYACEVATSKAQGIAIFGNRSIDLVIVDLNLHAGAGLKLVQELRATSDVPIILVTGYHQEYRWALRAIENVSLLDKPYDTNQLLDLAEADLVLHGMALP